MIKRRYIYPSPVQSVKQIDGSGWRVTVNNQGFIVPDEPNIKIGDTINVILEIEERTDAEPGQSPVG